MVHGVRAAMQSLKKTGTDFSSARGMDPKAFFEVMGTFFHIRAWRMSSLTYTLSTGLSSVVKLDAQAGGKAFEVV